MTIIKLVTSAQPRSTMGRLFVSILLPGSIVLGVSCQDYLPPPEPSLVGATQGLLSDPSKPVTIAFTKPVDPASLKIQIGRYDTPIHDWDPPLPTDGLIFSANGTSTPTNGTMTMPDSKTLQISFAKLPPVGPRLFILFEPGLSDDDGHATGANRVLLFGYQFVAPSMNTVTPATTFPSGDFFFVVKVEEPIATQIKLFAHLDVDASTGRFKGSFVSANRNRDLTRCPTLSCRGGDACETIPSQRCVVPSTPADDPDQFPDFVTNPTPPTGYTFMATGYVADQPDGTSTFGISPVDVISESPAVTVQAAQLSASFSVDSAGVLRGEGSLTATQLIIGTTPSGVGSGTMSARILPKDQVPMGIPPTTN